MTAATAWIRTLVAVGAALAIAGPALARDDRPSEMPYEMAGPLPQLSSDYRREDHKVVIIKDGALQPQTVVLEPGQLVAWISYARAASTIVFERETAKSMRCHSLVNFSIVEDEIRSAPIMPGEFASFCELEPGHYRYKVVRPDADISSALGSTGRLDGAVEVIAPKAQPAR
jgi:hypothetical protein